MHEAAQREPGDPVDTGQVLAHRWFIEDEAAVNAAKAVIFHNFEENENSDEE